MEAADHNSIPESLDHLFRQHAGQMVSILSRIFGLESLDMIEDAIQDSLVSALKNWSHAGIPDNPRAWLVQVSKNRVLDHLRYDKRFQNSHDDENSLANLLQTVDSRDDVYFSNEVGEDQLRMIFACCHTAIPSDSRVALTLRVVSGFRVFEIARAFLAKNESIAKMLSRAKQTLRNHKVQLEMPPPPEIPRRLDSVLKVLYLMFNEGYAASGGEQLIRRDLCNEAIRLSESLAKHPTTSSPTVHALTALFLFQGARLASRCGEEGELLLLSEQDRSLWDKKMLGQAMHHFRLSAHGDVLSDYHLEAEIAACHATVGNYDETRWSQILDCYELLQKRKFSPVVELNRIIVVTKIEGAAKGLEELNKFEMDLRLKDYNLYHITRGQFLSDTGETPEAIRSYKRAMELTRNEAVLRFIRARIRHLNN